MEDVLMIPKWFRKNGATASAEASFRFGGRIEEWTALVAVTASSALVVGVYVATFAATVGG